jgi:hypothetical protein
VFEKRHYFALIETKPNALDQAAPLRGWELPEAFQHLRDLLEARMGNRGRREFIQSCGCRKPSRWRSWRPLSPRRSGSAPSDSTPSSRSRWCLSSGGRLGST